MASVVCGALGRVATVVAALMSVNLVGIAAAVPQPHTTSIDPTSAKIGALTSRLVTAEAELSDLHGQVELTREDANKARVDLLRAQQAAQQAQSVAHTAAKETEAAVRQLAQQCERIDDFIASSYQRGNEIGGAGLFRTTRGPRDMLERAEMLAVFGESQRNILKDLRLAHVRKTNKDSVAEQAGRDAEAKRRTVQRIHDRAEDAVNAAVTARSVREAEIRALEADIGTLRTQLAVAREAIGQVGPVPNTDAATHSLAQAATAQGMTGTTAQVETVIQRLLSQVGVHYAWGGGNSSGPTRGIREGGVADSHGDDRKIGFDCSGLMLYGFASVGVELAHYSGYQYESGRQIPLRSKQRGDLLFWRSNGSTHHVALYLGDGQMIEAPHSGGQVRITLVRYAGIAPYAVRLV